MKKRAERNPLLDDLLDDVEDLRAASLERGLAALRRARRARRRRRPALWAGAAALFAAMVWLSNLPREGLNQPVTPPNNPSLAAAASRMEGKVKIISDDELLAQFPDRAVALIGPEGHRQLVFLDAGAISTRASVPH